jgi:hypothetical protein
MDFSRYRIEITVTDVTGHVLVLVLALVQFYLAHKAHQTGDRWYAVWISVFTVTMVGIIVRMDTMLKRLGGWLDKMGDPWEKALAAHGPTKYLMTVGDFLTFAVVIVMLVYGQVQAGPYFSTEPLKSWHVFSPRTWYRIGTLGGVALGILWWILAATKARTGF